MTIADPSVEETKRIALEWLAQRFEIVDPVWFPGEIKNGFFCPMAQVLKAAGYGLVWVGHSTIKYWSDDGDCIKVRMPDRVSAFPRLFDQGLIPELNYINGGRAIGQASDSVSVSQESPEVASGAAP